MRSWQSTESADWSLLTHGGAGDVPADLVAEHVEAARRAIEASRDLLARGGSALDAVEAAVAALEDEPCFNAGTGACLNEDGELELDASIMSGADLRAGAVCALPPFSNPIRIARAALDDGRHVLYAGEGAVRFARAHGFSPRDDGSMVTARARERFLTVQAKGEVRGWAGGTVGAVARDARGHVAAATSTGGRINKAKGRVGDSPILGAGTYADDASGAASCTGDGEIMMRLTTARAATYELQHGASAEDAARAVITDAKRRLRGEGGVIVVRRDGSLGWARNTDTMTWAAASSRWNEIKAGA